MSEAISRTRKELKLGQTLADKATQADVKAFAQRVVADYTKIDTELNALAQQKNMTLPEGIDPEQQRAMQSILDKNGADMENAYMQAIVKDHVDEIAACKRVAKEGKDADVKAFAAKTTPILQEHLRMGQNINKGTASNFVFATDALADGLLEVMLGKEVAEKATTPEVKAFAQQAATDHTKIDDELRALAQQKSVTLPEDLGKENQQVVDKLTGQSGPEMEKAYLQAMVKHHVDAMSAFEDAASDATDPDVKAFAAKTLPMLQEHLRMALNLSKSLGDKEKEAAK